jgi:O-antigen/teichoic acid export membrane protein
MPTAAGLTEPQEASPKRKPRFVSAALGTLGTQLGIAVLSFVGVILVARVLGPAGRGEVALLMTIVVLSSTLALLGVDEANVNFGALEPAARRALATNSLILSLALGGACIALLSGLIAVFPAIGGDGSAALRWFAMAVIPVLILKVYLKFLVRADYHFTLANVAWILPPALNVVAYAALAVAGELTVAAAIVTWGITHLIATLLLVAFVARRSVGFGRPDAALARRTLGFGWKSHLGRVMMAGNYRLDQWFVGAIAGTRELGLYSIAVAMAEILFYLPTALTIAQRPYLVRADRQEAGRSAARVFRASLLLSASAAAALALMAPWVVPTIFGESFRGSIDDIQVLSAGVVGILALKLLGNALTAKGRPDLATAGATAAFVATLGLNIILIPAHGGLGAAIASTLAYTAGGVAVAVIFLRFFRAPARLLVPRARELPPMLRSVSRVVRSFNRKV